MMHIERYNSERLEFIKQLLINSVETGKPQDYEIRVDDMRVVPRTNNPDLFENYEDFITEQTRRVLVMLYEGVSRKNAKYLFHLKEEDMPKQEQKGLSGKAEVEKIISEKLEQQAQKWKQEQMEKELKELKEENKQNEKDFEKVIAHNKKLEAGRDLEDMQWGKILGAAGDTLLRSNTKFLAKIPALQGLAGIIEADTKEREKRIESPRPEPEVEASFKMKSEKEQDDNREEKNEVAEKKEKPRENSEQSEEERDQLGFLRQLHQRFEEKQVKQILSLLNCFVDNPKALEQILNVIQEKRTKAKSENKKAENEPQHKKPNPNSEAKQQEQTEEKEKIKPEQKQENSSEEENSQVNNLEEKKEETELTNFLVPENQKKENDFNELPVTI